tara:strand:- start:1116 stop:3518 length:2403 start_codon:yes stop_codon:yes gene_type:complete
MSDFERRFYGMDDAQRRLPSNMRVDRASIKNLNDRQHLAKLLKSKEYEYLQHADLKKQYDKLMKNIINQKKKKEARLKSGRVRSIAGSYQRERRGTLISRRGQRRYAPDEEVKVVGEDSRTEMKKLTDEIKNFRSLENKDIKDELRNLNQQSYYRDAMLLQAMGGFNADQSRNRFNQGRDPVVEDLGTIQLSDVQRDRVREGVIMAGDAPRGPTTPFASRERAAPEEGVPPSTPADEEPSSKKSVISEDVYRDWVFAERQRFKPVDKLSIRGSQKSQESQFSTTDLRPPPPRGAVADEGGFAPSDDLPSSSKSAESSDLEIDEDEEDDVVDTSWFLPVEGRSEKKQISEISEEFETEVASANLPEEQKQKILKQYASISPTEREKVDADIEEEAVLSQRTPREFFKPLGDQIKDTTESTEIGQNPRLREGGRKNWKSSISASRKKKALEKEIEDRQTAARTAEELMRQPSPRPVTPIKLPSPTPELRGMLEKFRNPSAEAAEPEREQQVPTPPESDSTSSSAESDVATPEAVTRANWQPPGAAEAAAAAEAALSGSDQSTSESDSTSSSAESDVATPEAVTRSRAEAAAAAAAVVAASPQVADATEPEPETLSVDTSMVKKGDTELLVKKHPEILQHLASGASRSDGLKYINARRDTKILKILQEQGTPEDLKIYDKLREEQRQINEEALEKAAAADAEERRSIKSAKKAEKKKTPEEKYPFSIPKVGEKVMYRKKLYEVESLVPGLKREYPPSVVLKMDDAGKTRDTPLSKIQFSDKLVGGKPKQYILKETNEYWESKQ